MFRRKHGDGDERPAGSVTPAEGTAHEGPTDTGPSSTRLGKTTLEFFSEGERHEAAGWTDTPLPPDDEPAQDPKIRFKSFDKIAKQRSSIVALPVMVIGLAIAVTVGIVAALRTEHAMNSSFGAFFGHHPERNPESIQAPAVLPPPIPIPDAGSPRPLPHEVNTSTATARGTSYSQGR